MRLRWVSCCSTGTEPSSWQRCRTLLTLHHRLPLPLFLIVVVFLLTVFFLVLLGVIVSIVLYVFFAALDVVVTIYIVVKSSSLF